VLGWLATRPDGHYFANQCRAWADSIDAFRYFAHADAELASGTAGLLERLSAAAPPAESDYYLAGPAEFVARAATALAERGIPAARIRS
jgi:CDP-4-dehydro-6-deoxyglucose reductase